MVKMTFAVDNIADLGDPGEHDSFEIYVVIGDEAPKKIREMRIAYLKEMRDANGVPDDVTDVDFLLGDPQFRRFASTINIRRIEFALSNMAAKSTNSEEQQRVEFPANAFAGGDVKALDGNDKKSAGA